MSQTKKKQVWAYTLQFMSAFRPLTYRGVHVNELLFRDFQRFCHTHGRLFPTIAKRSSLRSLQMKSAKYFCANDQTALNVSRTGYTLVRGELHQITQGAKREKFLYVAHRKREHNMLLGMKSCRPLLYLPAIKAKRNQSAQRIIIKKLHHLFRAKKTPKVFKSITFKRWMVRKTKAALRQLDKASAIFQKYPIKQVLYGSTLNWHGALMTSYAKSKRIPTINLQHGIFGEYGHLPVNADWNLVWGPSHAKYLIRRGASAKRIKVVGPLFSRSLDGRYKNALRIKSGKDKAMRILVALQPLGEKYNVRMIRTIDRAARQLKKYKKRVHVCYKLHPSQQTTTSFERAIKHRTSIVLKHGITPLYTLIKQSDLVITPFSTVAYEALIMQKPVLFYGKQRRMYYLRNYPPCFQNVQQLLKWLKQNSTKSQLTPKLLARGDARCRSISIWSAIRQFRKASHVRQTEQQAKAVETKHELVTVETHSIEKQGEDNV